MNKNKKPKSLPLSLKSELLLCGYYFQWVYFPAAVYNAEGGESLVSIKHFVIQLQ